MNFNNYKFRSSQLPSLMTTSKSKLDLSETTKSILNEIYIKEIYKREKIIVSKYMEKGTEKENDSISLYRKVTQQFVTKNENQFENEFLTGTPDLILNDRIVDIKTNWDIWTFFKSNEKTAKSDYYWQLVAYMILTGKKKADLAYCLISNDDYTVYSETQKVKFFYGLTDESPDLEKLEEQIKYNNTYDDIPPHERVKIFSFELDQDDEENIRRQVNQWREYLYCLSLSNLSQMPINQPK